MIAQSHKCPECTSSISLYTGSKCEYFGCPGCGAYFKVETSGWKKLLKLELPVQSSIRIGMTLHLDGRDYTVISHSVKGVDNGLYKWREYLLFHPMHPIASLSENNGHWHFFQAKPLNMPAGRLTLDHDNRTYRLFSKDKVETFYAIGEYTMASHSFADYAEYISPPYIISREKCNGHTETYFGRYLEPSELKKANTSITDLPWRQGVGAAQFNNSKVTPKDVKRILAGYLLLLVLVILFTWTRTEEKMTLNLSADEESGQVVSDSAKSVYTTSDPFVIENDHSAVQLDYYSYVQNTWVSTETILVNETTGDEITAWQDIEFYSGTDGDGAWSEGTQRPSKIISNLKAGTYHLLAKAEHAPGSTTPNVNIRLSVNPPLYSNLILFLILGLIYPFIYWWQRSNFETRRWNNSDYGS